MPNDRNIPAPPPVDSRIHWRDTLIAATAAHFAVACSPDHDVASGRSYNRSRAAFKAVINVVYPELDTDAIYGVWVDCMEPVPYCAEWVRNADRDDLRKFSAIGRG